MEYLRAQSRNRVVLSDATLLSLESAVQSLSEEHLAARRATLQKCVRQLRGRQKQVIELRYLKEQSVEDIASGLATSCSSIAVTLHRARAALRECVSRTLGAEGGAS